MMGWVSEYESLSPLSSPCRLTSRQPTSLSRWLSRFFIAKGGHVYLFKHPPVAILKAFKGKLAQSSRRNHSGSSLGSVGSSTSDASTSSTSSTQLSLAAASTSSDLLMSKTRRSKPDRVERANQDLEKELLAASMNCFVACKSDFRIVKSSELLDAKDSCFLLNNGSIITRYFSTENAVDLQKLQTAWTRTNYHSVTKFKVSSNFNEFKCSNLK